MMTELGDMLKETRESQQLTLDDIQQQTKIQKRYLSAVEEGAYDKLPGDFYTRIFVKSYAEALQLNPDQVFADYAHDIPGMQYHLPTEMPSRTQQRHAQAGQSRVPTKFLSVFMRILTALVIIAVIVGIYFLFLHLMMVRHRIRSIKRRHQPVSKNEDLASPPSDEQKANAEQNASDKQSPSQDSSSTNDNETTAETQPAPTLVKKQKVGGVTHYVLKHADHFKIKIKVSGAKSWVEVRKQGANGKKYVYTLMQNGDVISKDLSSDQAIFLNVGNTESTKIYINGELFQYPSDSVTQKILIKRQNKK